jgi:hypothetical protein
MTFELLEETLKNGFPFVLSLAGKRSLMAIFVTHGKTSRFAWAMPLVDCRNWRIDLRSSG